MNVDKFFQKHPKLKWPILGLLVLGVLFMLVQGYRTQGGSNGSSADPSALPSGVVEINNGVVNDGGTTSNSINGGTDQLIAQMQPDLVTQYGKAPDGFVWDQQGNLISLGIKGMTSDGAAFAYVRALSTLDMSIAQKLSRESSVVSSYREYFDSTSTSNRVDYNDEFTRNVYKAGMLSIENNGVVDSSTFADNKRSYTFTAKMLDFTNKDFWRKDQATLFAQIYKFDQEQSDSAKAEQYVNKYILDYYNSPAAKKTDVKFTITVQTYPDLNSGWVVSIDKDLDDLLKNSGGVQVNQYIMSQYQNFKMSKTTK